MELPFVQYDVFTSKPLAGNPLAVFPEASGLDSRLMQMIAREMNLSESSFIISRSDATAEFGVRIFTPLKEIPFAGHPTIGTAFHLFSELPECSELTLNLPAGKVAVWADRNSGLFVWFRPPPAILGPEITDMQFVCDLTGLQPSEIADIAPVQTAGTGTSYLMVPLRSIESLERASCNQGLLESNCAQLGFDKLTVFTLNGYCEDSAIATRMFAPLHGVPEDPATGSSASALTHYLRFHGVIDDTGDAWFAIDQGYSINRPSTIFARANLKDGQIEVRIGGTTTRIGSGSLKL